MLGNDKIKTDQIITSQKSMHNITKLFVILFVESIFLKIKRLPSKLDN